MYRPLALTAAAARPFVLWLTLLVGPVAAPAAAASDGPAGTGSAGTGSTGAGPVTVKVAGSRPPCEPYGRPGSLSELDRQAMDESLRRCYGTGSDDYTLNLAPGESLALYGSEPAPHAFLRLRRLWIDTASVDQPVLVFRLAERDGSRLLRASADGRQWQVELIPGRWMELDMSPYGNLWVKAVAEDDSDAG